MNEPGVGPVPSNTSARFIGILTGRPVFLRQHRRDRLEVDADLAAEAAADLHRHDLDLRHGDAAAARRTCARTVNAPCVLLQIVRRPSAFHSAVALCGSM